MKENIDDENQENLINIDVKEDNDKSKEKTSKKIELPSIADTIIDPSEKNNLKTLDEQLNERDSDYDLDDDMIYEDDNNKEDNDINKESSTLRIIFIMKNYLFIFCLLFSSFLNYNFLHFPYIILGFILSYFIFRNKIKKIYNFRKISELVIFIYSLLLLIFKIVLIVLTKKENNVVLEHKNLFINLGVKLLKDENSVLYLVSSFLSECIIIIISIISFIISACFIDFKDFKLEEEVNYEDKTEKEMYSLLIKHLIINYFFFLFFAILNTSILTIVYLSFIGFTFFLTVKNTNLNKILLLFKLVALINYILLILQIFFINLFNCYAFEDIIASESIETDSGIKYYSIYSQIGIKIMLKNDSILKRIFHCLSYFFAIISFCSISTSNYVFSFNLHKKKFLIDKNEEKIDSKNICIKIRLKLKLFFTSPGFILHICRLFGIVFLYFFRNLFGLVDFIWLFFSFLNFRVRSNKTDTFILLFFLYISNLLFHISNIDGYFETEKIFYYHINLYKIDKRFVYYALYLFNNLFIFFDIVFIYTVYNNKETSIDIIEPDTDEIKTKQLKLKENLLNQENEEKNKEDKNKLKLIDDENNSDNKEQEEKEEKEDSNIKLNELSDKIKAKEIEEEKILNKLKISKETLQKLTFLNIIKKTIIVHIDKLALIAMYFICLNSINIMHFILVVIFMIQLLFPELIVIISKYLMIIMQILYLAEFGVDISKRYALDYFNRKEKLIKIFMDYDTDKSSTSVEIYFYIIVYCFYIQYKLYDHKFYKKVVANNDISLSNYILVKFHSYPTIRSILFFIGKLIIEIYIWVLIILFIFFDTFFEINFLFEIKLIIFFIIVFQFLISIQNPKEKYISLILNWTFLCYCSLNSFLVYGYQIICLDYFKDESESKSKNFFKENLPSIGFSIYKDKLFFRFLPHFICNFISILFLWEMKRILLNKNKEEDDDPNNDKKTEEIKDKEKEELGATKLYEENKNRMKKLDLFYYLYNIVLIITKFYWLFLFIFLGIIFTVRDLSVILILYILIFGIIYIGMFHRIITKLNSYIQKKSFFISRLIRYNLVELNLHHTQNRYYRSLGFQYLLMLCLISYIFFYTFGIYHRIQNGCSYLIENGKSQWEGCDNRHGKIYNDEDNIFGCIAYLLGFYTECDYVFEKSWFHLFFAFLICLDIYVLKLENLFNEKVRDNREEYKFLLNKNIQLKVLTFGEKNILFNIRYFLDNQHDKKDNLENSDEKMKEIENEEENKMKKSIHDSIKKIKEEKRIYNYDDDKKIEFKLDIENEEEDKTIGEKLIINLMKILSKSTQHSDIKLSGTNSKFGIIKVIKKIFEEIIIFFLICTSISKMDIWSFQYIIISIILITTKKTMIKFYILYCFIISSTMLQLLTFVSNIQKSTKPFPNLDLLKELSVKFNVPWYKHGKVQLDDKMAYFFGLGAAKSQINLIWMEFIEIVIIYIYLDYFSYSIYQDGYNTIASKDEKKQEELNYYNLRSNKETIKSSMKLTDDEYKKHVNCMQYNFNVNLTYRFHNLLIFKDFMKTGILPKLESENIIKKINNQLPEIKEEPEENKDELDEEKKKVDEKNELIISTKSIEGEEKEKFEIEPSPLISNLQKGYSMIKTQKKTLFDESNIKSEDNKNKCISRFKDFLFLSFHNVILILIIILSMTISGLFSIFYIAFSLYFLITSTSIYLGNNYLYPKAIKIPMRIIIIIDILAQISYQVPFVDTDNKVLEFIGLNKIINYTQIEEKSDSDIQLNMKPLFIVIAKAIIYLLMSFQVLIYFSHDFQEYYLSYIITKNNKLRRISRINVYQFNNNRIAVMNDSFNLREKMNKMRRNLENKIEQWKFDLKNTIHKRIKKEDSIQIIDATKNKETKEIEEKEEDNNSLNEEESKIKLTGGKKVNLKAKKIKKKEEQEKEKEIIKEENILEEQEEKSIEEPKEKENEEIEKKEEKEEEQKTNLEDELKEENPSQIFSKVLSNFQIDFNKINKEKEKVEEKSKVLKEEEAKKKIKDALLSGFFMGIYLKLNNYSSNYASIKKGEKDLYEKNVIKGDSKVISFIESQVDMMLETLDLKNYKFTEREIKEIIHYLDGTTEKKLKEKKKKEEKEKKKKKKAEKGKKKKNKEKDDNNKEIEDKIQEEEIIEEEEKKEGEKNKEKEKIEEEEKKEEEQNKEEEKIEEEEEKKEEENEKNIKQEKEKKKLKEENEEKNEKILDFKNEKFKQFESILTSKLFVKYLKTSYIIKCIFREIYNYFLLNFHWLCYLMMLISHMVSASILTLFYPLTIFCYAILEYPRPKKFYWRIVLFYTVFLLIIKFIIHIELLRSNKSFSDFITKLTNYKIGLKIYESSFSPEFFLYIFCDALVLVFLLINDYLLVSRGIWLKREQEIETIYQANKRIAEAQEILKKGKIDIKKFNNKFLEKIEDIGSDEKNKDELKNNDNKKKERKQLDHDKIIKGLKLKLKLSTMKSTKESLNENNEYSEDKIKRKIEKMQKAKERADIEKKEREKYDESSRKYFESLFPKIRNEKPGADFYVWYTLSLAIIIIIILIFYTSMVNDKTFGSVEIDTKQVSGEMVLVLIIHVLILLYDRVLFINQSRNKLEYENYSYTNIQKEDFNCIILQKYILHMTITILIHGFIFIYCPMIGNYHAYGNVYCPNENEIDEGEDEGLCNDFKFNKTLIIFYLVYIIYLVSSGLQIKYGFYDMRKKSLLKSGHKSINGYIYNVYKAIPFLYEIKLAIDWTFTKTCLDLFQWNKYESTYDIIFVTFCQMTAKNIQLVGKKVKVFFKIFMGGLLAFALIIILIIPLMLFSSLNPTNKLNNLTGAVCKIDLCFFYKNKFVKNYTLYENSRPESIDTLNDEDFILYNYSKSVKSKNFEREQIQTVTFFTDSDKNWDLTDPLVEQLKYLIRNRKNISDLEYIALALDYNFERPLPKTSNKINKRYTHTIYYYNNYTKEPEYEYIENLLQALEKCHDTELTYKNFYSPPIRLSSDVKPKRLIDQKYFNLLDIKLGYVGCKNVTKKNGSETVQIPNYLESYFTLKKVMKIGEEIKEEGLKFHVFSDKVSSTISGKSILTLYISFVLVVGNYVRNFFAGQPEKIRLTEMPYPEEIVDLCEGIKLSRNSYEFKKEEKLYYMLIELMRSPEYLRDLTLSSLEQFKKRKEATKEKTADS